MTLGLSKHQMQGCAIWLKKSMCCIRFLDHSQVSYLIVYVSLVVEESIAIVVHDHRIDCFGIVLDDRRVSRPRRISRGIDTDYRTTSLVIALFLVFDLRRSSRARINDDRFSRTRWSSIKTWQSVQHRDDHSVFASLNVSAICHYEERWIDTPKLDLQIFSVQSG